MAVIEGATTAQLAEVDANTKGLRIATVPKDVSGAYAVGAVTGVLPAALASGSVIWALRIGSSGSTRRAIITRIYSKFVTRAAATAFTDVALELVRFSGANHTAGAALPIANKRPNGIAAVASAALTGGTEGGDARIALTSALGNAGITYDASSPHTFLYIPVISATAPPAGTLYERSIENDAGLEHPFELSPGEGLAIRTVGAIPASMTLQGHIQVSWSERT